MKKTFFIMALFIIFTAASCITLKEVPKGMTPEQTVRLYFEYYSKRDSAGMNSLVIKTYRSRNYNLRNLDYVKLFSCKEREDKGQWYEPWYEDPYDYAVVDVSFEIKFIKNAPDSGFNEGVNNLDSQYFLVKENENSDWIIVMWGVG